LKLSSEYFLLFHKQHVTRIQRLVRCSADSQPNKSWNFVVRVVVWLSNDDSRSIVRCRRLFAIMQVKSNSLHTILSFLFSELSPTQLKTLTYYIIILYTRSTQINEFCSSLSHMYSFSLPFLIHKERIITQ